MIRLDCRIGTDEEILETGDFLLETPEEIDGLVLTEVKDYARARSGPLFVHGTVNVHVWNLTRGRAMDVGDPVSAGDLIKIDTQCEGAKGIGVKLTFDRRGG